ncbi:tetratricopeptide repeat protein [uncultured Polaribacter sp.]|uniref:tetratricopeptide repeat protein n=1 Tax=uncultured Polaribacter sp. TaxID=174711 RepID=UPI002616B947|nr:tetratricopeptide repeat protein [uncultured Polaribacter sp.]
MKKQVLALTLGLFSLTIFAQKDEIKAIEKAVKKLDFKEAKTLISELEKNEDAIEEKYKAKYYFLKGSAYSKSNLAKSAAAYKKLIKVEKASGKIKYTKEARTKINDLVTVANNKAIEDYNSKNYKKAAKNFVLSYKLNPKDTASLFNAATSASIVKDYDTALKHYIKLKNLGYTGIATTYFAVNKANGQKENVGSKKNQETYVKIGTHEKPTFEISTSKKADIIKNIGYIYVNQGNPEKAIEALGEARKADPKDVNLIMNEAQMYIELDRMDKFGELMQEATKLDPTNPTLFFNLGVVNQNEGRMEEAKKYYGKALELKPDYQNALLNYAIAILAGEQAIVEEMNKNLSNFKKYDALAAKQKALYKEALPYLEKADSLERNYDSVRTLLNIYDTLEMTEKADALRPVFKEMRSKQ